MLRAEAIIFDAGSTVCYTFYINSVHFDCYPGSRISYINTWEGKNRRCKINTGGKRVFKSIANLSSRLLLHFFRRRDLVSGPVICYLYKNNIRKTGLRNMRVQS